MEMDKIINEIDTKTAEMHKNLDTLNKVGLAVGGVTGGFAAVKTYSSTKSLIGSVAAGILGFVGGGFLTGLIGGSALLASSDDNLINTVDMMNEWCNERINNK